MLVHIDSICWADINSEAVVTNIKDLTKTAYVEVPKGNIEDYKVYEAAKEKLYEMTNVIPWYFNMEYVCET